MLIEKNIINDFNSESLKSHSQKFDFVASSIGNTEDILQKLIDFQIAIPSWALGAGGTRFGRFSIGGEPSNLEEKIEEVSINNDYSEWLPSVNSDIAWSRLSSAPRYPPVSNETW